MPGRWRGGLAATIAFAALWLAPGALASSQPEGCATLIADPAPGYRGPLLHGFSCDYRAEAPEVTWTVPAGVTEAQFHVYGGDGPAGRGGEVKATLPVTPGENLTLAMGHEGGASSVRRDSAPLLVAGGGDGKELNYAEPGAREVSSRPPGAPLPPYPADGRIYGSWYEGWVELPDNRCLVPRLRGRKPAVARRLLFEAGCTVGTIDRRPSRRALRGRVVGQGQKPGTRLYTGSPVSFTVGRRP